MAIQVLITDDPKVVRQGLRGFLELDPALEVVGEAWNGEEAVELARSLKPDVVLMDLLRTADADELSRRAAGTSTSRSGPHGTTCEPPRPSLRRLRSPSHSMSRGSGQRASDE